MNPAALICTRNRRCHRTYVFEQGESGWLPDRGGAKKNSCSNARREKSDQALLAAADASEPTSTSIAEMDGAAHDTQPGVCVHAGGTSRSPQFVQVRQILTIQS